jgi:hypothetical protein
METGDDKIFDPFRPVRHLFRRIREDEYPISEKYSRENLREGDVTYEIKKGLVDQIFHHGLELDKVLNRADDITLESNGTHTSEQFVNRLREVIERHRQGKDILGIRGDREKWVIKLGEEYFLAVRDVARAMSERGIVTKGSFDNMQATDDKLIEIQYVSDSKYLAESIEDGIIKDKITKLTPKQYRFRQELTSAMGLVNNLLGLPENMVSVDKLLSNL